MPHRQVQRVVPRSYQSQTMREKGTPVVSDPASRAWALVLALGLAAAPAAGYTLTDLGPGRATGLNEQGQVVGWSAGGGSNRAFSWQAGALTLTPLGDAFQSGANDVNNHGQIVGWVQTPSQPRQHAFLYGDGQTSEPDIFDSRAEAINDAGQVVGHADDRAWLWDGTNMTDLGSFGGSWAHAFGINASGQAVGQAGDSQGRGRAFLWQDAEMVDLGTLGGPDSAALGINDLGHVVGWADTGTGRQAAIWMAGGITPLGPAHSAAADINNLGIAVGFYHTGPFHDQRRACLWDNGGMTDLTDLLPQDSAWVLEYAAAINDLGWIAGYGQMGGQTHGFVLITPEPVTGLLLAVGATLLPRKRSTRRL